MKISSLKNLFLYTTILCIYNTNSFAQTETVTLEQDPKFEQLLNEKRKINTAANDLRFIISVFTIKYF